MAYELIYTSVPHGLKLGSSGFCTVAMTNGMPSPLARVMEGMTGYKPLYPMSDSRFANNPPSYFHYSVKVGGSSYDVCGRICSCPIDYTGRTNKIAHFIVPDEMEKQQMPLGAASLSEEMFRTAWATVDSLAAGGATGQFYHGEGGGMAKSHWRCRMGGGACPEFPEQSTATRRYFV